MNTDVRIDRERYIGGSDVACIMGLSHFKTRWQLLLEKAGLAKDEFPGNRYTEYGNVLEPQIRAYMEFRDLTDYSPDTIIDGDLRGNMDGFDGNKVLEIKTTSQVYPYVDGYKHYLVQLLFYMHLAKVKRGVLAAYERPDDFDTTFDAERLQIFEIYAEEWQWLTADVLRAIERFRADIAKVKENPLTSEEDLYPTAIVELSHKMVALEERMQAYKELEVEYATVKAKLYHEMEKGEIKSWETPTGTKITRVDGTLPSVKTVEEFNELAFKLEHPELHQQYVRTVEKKSSGKSGYVKITFPKQA